MKISKETKMVNVKNLDFASKEMKALAQNLRLCNSDTPDEANKLAAKIVEASFFINCFTVAAQAFGKAYQDVQKESLKGDALVYLKDEFVAMVDARDLKTEKLKAEAQDEGKL